MVFIKLKYIKQQYKLLSHPERKPFPFKEFFWRFAIELMVDKAKLFIEKTFLKFFKRTI